MTNNRVALPILVLLTLAVFGLVPGVGRAGAITLQQGVDGYSGCSDSFIANGTYPDNQSQNFGSCSELRAWCGHYASW